MIVANWKMNGTWASLEALASEIKLFTPDLDPQVVVCAPSPYIASLSKLNLPFALGGQDCSSHPQGAFTGEVSAPMLKDCGAEFVLIGHSERRLYHHESEELLKEKYQRALESGLTPILCAGETLEERNQNITFKVIEDQLKLIESTHQPAIIAYEPRWAIGTGLIPTNNEIKEILHAIRDHLPMSVKLLYGGSVTGDNASELKNIPGLNGLLVGGASLKAHEFRKIVNAWM